MGSLANGDKSEGPSVPAKDRTLRVRQHLIAAGMYEYAMQGFEATTLKAIAARAGVNVAALDYHFSSKDDLWKASAEKIFGEFHTTFGTVLETSAKLTPRERAEALITEAVVFFAQHPELHRFLTGENKGPRIEWLTEVHIQPLHSIFDALMADLDERLGGDVPDRTHLFYMFIGAASAPYQMPHEFSETNGMSPDDAEAVTRHAAAMMLTFLPPADEG